MTKPGKRALPPVMPAERPLKPALRRGWRRRCPNCGRGALLSGYLGVADHCTVCDEPFHHHRADDGPAYITILIVGHVMVPLIMVLYTGLHMQPLAMAIVLTVICVALSLFLLPRIKGAFIALQWAKRMHGFGAPDDGPER